MVVGLVCSAVSMGLLTVGAWDTASIWISTGSGRPPVLPGASFLASCSSMCPWRSCSTASRSSVMFTRMPGSSPWPTNRPLRKIAWALLRASWPLPHCSDSIRSLEDGYIEESGAILRGVEATYGSYSIRKRIGSSPPRPPRAWGEAWRRWRASCRGTL